MRLVAAVAVFVTIAMSPMLADEHSASTTSAMSVLIKGWADELLLKLQQTDTVNIDVSEHPDRDWIESVIVDHLVSKGAVVQQRKSGRRHHIVIADAATRYAATDHSDSVRRTITFHVRALVVNDDANADVALVPTEVASSSSVVARKDVRRLESTQHASTHGVVPERVTTFWDDILEPAIYIGAAVVTAVLLFTVRSQ